MLTGFAGCMGFGSVGDTKVHAGPVSVAEHAFPSPILLVRGNMAVCGAVRFPLWLVTHEQQRAKWSPKFPVCTFENKIMRLGLRK